MSGQETREADRDEWKWKYCGSCKFRAGVGRNTNGQVLYDCRRHPPSMGSGHDQASRFPAVSIYSTACSEHTKGET